MRQKFSLIIISATSMWTITMPAFYHIMSTVTVNGASIGPQQHKTDSVKRQQLAEATTIWNPCEFPGPNGALSVHEPSEIIWRHQTEFATRCQLEYHQLPFLCDPGGLLSRTEAEL